MRMISRALMIVAAAALLAIPALANSITTTVSASGQWQGEDIDTATFFIETPGVTFGTPSLTTDQPGWTVTDHNGQYVSMQGPEANFINYTLTFTASGAFTWDWHGSLNGVSVNDDGSTTWDPSIQDWVDGPNGGNAVFATAADEPANTPEPGTLVLLGSGLIGGIGAIRRRF